MTGGQTGNDGSSFMYTMQETSNPVLTIGAFVDRNSACTANTNISYVVTGGPIGFITKSGLNFTLNRSVTTGPFPQRIELMLSVSNFFASSP